MEDEEALAHQIGLFANQLYVEHRRIIGRRLGGATNLRKEFPNMRARNPRISSEFRTAGILVEFFPDQFDTLDMQDSQNRITVNPRQCGGRPCVRGMRIRVSDVLDLFASGLTAAQILEEMPDLEAEDLKARLTYARRRIDHPVLAVCEL